MRRMGSSHRIFAWWRKLAMGYHGYGLPVGELISEGNIGMMQARVTMLEDLAGQYGISRELARQIEVRAPESCKRR